MDEMDLWTMIFKTAAKLLDCGDVSESCGFLTSIAAFLNNSLEEKGSGTEDAEDVEDLEGGRL